MVADEDQHHLTVTDVDPPPPALLMFRDQVVPSPRLASRALPRLKAKPISSSPRAFQRPTAHQQRGKAWTVPPVFHPPFHRAGLAAFLSPGAFALDPGLFPWQEMSVIP